MIIIIPFLLWTGKVEIKVEAPSLKDAVVRQVKDGANLYGADLRGADLRGANLYGADLRGADLYGADLYGANLYGANLYGADLYGANLYGANLYGADLYGADLYGADLRGADHELIATLVKIGLPYFVMGPIGSRNDQLQAFNTDKGIYIQTGCFGPKPMADFVAAVLETHGNNKHASAYLAAVDLIKKVMG